MAEHHDAAVRAVLSSTTSSAKDDKAATLSGTMQLPLATACADRRSAGALCRACVQCLWPSPRTSCPPPRFVPAPSLDHLTPRDSGAIGAVRLDVRLAVFRQIRSLRRACARRTKAPVRRGSVLRPRVPGRVPAGGMEGIGARFRCNRRPGPPGGTFRSGDRLPRPGRAVSSSIAPLQGESAHWISPPTLSHSPGTIAVGSLNHAARMRSGRFQDPTPAGRRCG